MDRRRSLAFAALAATTLVRCESAGSSAGAAAHSAVPSPLAGDSTPSPPVDPAAAPAPEQPPGPAPHPLSIAALRTRDYPGSALAVEQALAPRPGYSREVVSYRSDGLRLRALLAVPEGQRPPGGWPVLILNHGLIPPRQYRGDEHYATYIDGFARGGYLVFLPDYRGHGESEGQADQPFSATDYVVDVLNGLASVRRHPGADPSRVGMWGYSMGGFVTLRAMVTARDLRAGVIWAGTVGTFPDLLTRWAQPPATSMPIAPGAVGATGGPATGIAWVDELIATYGWPDDSSPAWAALSANTFVGDLSAAIQLHHGAADTSVPLWMSQRLERDLRAAGKQVELIVYPDDDHNLAASTGIALSRSVAFFDAHVKRA
jgi:dipeptidyl aminopeptidase/acylaminoacyl peptidase